MRGFKSCFYCGSTDFEMHPNGNWYCRTDGCLGRVKGVIDPDLVPRLERIQKFKKRLNLIRRGNPMAKQILKGRFR